MNEGLSAKKTFSISSVRTALIFVFFILIAFQPISDPDFGWHLKAGEYIVQHLDVPDANIYSYTNLDYRWPDNAVLSEVLFYFLYIGGGHSTVLIRLFSLAAAIALFLFLVPNTYIYRKDEAGPRKMLFEDRVLLALLGLAVTRMLFYVNPLIFDYFGFVLVLLILERYKVLGEKRLLWLLPPIFFFWMLFHSGFLVGFILIGLFLFSELLESMRSGVRSVSELARKLSFPFLITLLSGVVTLLGPYGYRLHQDSFLITSSPLMRDIQYWKPTYLTISSNPFYAYLILFFVLLVATRRKLPFRFFLYCFFFMGFAFYAFRFMPFFVFSTIPVLWSIDKDKRIHVPVFLFLIFLAVAEAVIVHNVATHVVFVPKPQAIRELFEEKNIFVNDAPVRAFEYIKTHPMPDRMFNEFDWGGALTWYYPERKVFINGNMVHWKDVNGHYIYADSNAIKGAKENWRELIRYYGINWFLVRANTPISTVLSELPTEWANVYRDEKAVIFVKK